MTDRQLTVIAGGKSASPDEGVGSGVRSELAENGAAFVAQLDLDAAQARFCDLLTLPGQDIDLIEDAVERYHAVAVAHPVALDVQASLDRHRAVDDVTLGGVVKFFDIARGYGFVMPDNGLPDAYLHVNTLRLGGFRLCPSGARIVCLITQEEPGFRVTTVQAIDVRTSIDPSQLPRRWEPLVRRIESWALATVCSFNWRRGMGVLQLPDGREVHLSIATLRRCGMVYVEAGDVFEVLVGEGAKGVMAVEVRLPGSRQFQ